MPVDFEQVKLNAAAQGVDLASITIQYEQLTVDELRQMRAFGLVSYELNNGRIMALFPEDGNPLFPHKATAVFCLNA